uniref:Uncharacterized protein n=1 Tax=Anguilla anguilla TaxID=7936 RepID=A0A0E9U6U2_ANGAN
MYAKSWKFTEVMFHHGSQAIENCPPITCT